MPLPATGVALVLRRANSIVPAWAAHIAASDRVAGWLAVLGLALPSAAVGGWVGVDGEARWVLGGLIFVGLLIMCGFTVIVRRMLASSRVNELAGSGHSWRSRPGYYLYSYSRPDHPRWSSRLVVSPPAYLAASARGVAIVPLRGGLGRQHAFGKIASIELVAGLRRPLVLASRYTALRHGQVIVHLRDGTREVFIGAPTEGLAHLLTALGAQVRSE